jgi:RND family efflux transporter MFP subunit
MKKIIFIVGGLVIASLIAFTLVKNKSEIDEAATYREKIANVPVQIYTTQSEPVVGEYAYIGTFEPNREVTFGAETQGKVVALSVEEGQTVIQGQIIGKIDDEMLKIRLATEQVGVETQQANLQKLSRDLERYENLNKAEATSDINLQNARLGQKQANLSLKSAESQVKSTQKSIAQTNIVAPISGTLTEKRIELGSVLAPGTPVGTITDISRLKFRVLVPEKELQKFKLGQVVKIVADVYPQIEFEGIVNLVSVKGDVAHNYKVEVLVNNSLENPLRAGMYGKLNGKSNGSSNKILVPRAAVVGSVKSPQVFIAQNGKAVLKNVVLGNTYGDKLVIESGLNVGENVIITGQLNLENGTTIKISK